MNEPCTVVLTSAERQALIEWHLDEMGHSHLRTRRAHWERARELINGRSAEEVARMERERGIAHA